MAKASLTGVIDLHTHMAPDVRERRYTDIDLAKAAVRVGVRGVAIKSHHGATMNRAFLVNQYAREVLGAEDFVMIGTVVLNHAIGGLNPVAVDTAFRMGAKIVFLPTVHSSNHLAKHGKSGGIESVVDGRVVEPLREIFRMIKDNDGVLATAHLAPAEIFAVVEEARTMGLAKIVVTHPEFWIVGMSLEDQIRIVRDYDVLLERCFAQPVGDGVYKSNLEDNLVAIREVGCKNILVSTDGGQVENPPWEVALETYLQFLLDNDVGQEQVDWMTRTTPAALMNL